MKTIEEVLAHIEAGIEHFEKRCLDYENRKGDIFCPEEYYKFVNVTESLLSLYNFITDKSHPYSEQYIENDNEH